jgi:hypothetical protein
VVPVVVGSKGENVLLGLVVDEELDRPSVRVNDERCGEGGNRGTCGSVMI